MSIKVFEKNSSEYKKEKMYKCEICDKEFKNNQYLRQHFNNVHNLTGEHHCNICQKVFKLQNKLTSHMKIVHENKKYH